jgi:uncharacterized protein YrzB (UPF0473 family)
LFDFKSTGCYAVPVILPVWGEEGLNMSDEHNHDNHQHGPDCDHDHDPEMDEVIVLEDEDGVEHNFVLGEVLTVEGKEYAVLLPIDEDLEEGVIFRIDGEEGDQMVLSDIENDEEWQKVVDAYNEQLDDEDEEDEDED